MTILLLIPDRVGPKKKKPNLRNVGNAVHQAAASACQAAGLKISSARIFVKVAVACDADPCGPHLHGDWRFTTDTTRFPEVERAHLASLLHEELDKAIWVHVIEGELVPMNMRLFGDVFGLNKLTEHLMSH